MFLGNFFKFIIISYPNWNRKKKFPARSSNITIMKKPVLWKKLYQKSLQLVLGYTFFLFHLYKLLILRILLLILSKLYKICLYFYQSLPIQNIKFVNALVNLSLLFLIFVCKNMKNFDYTLINFVYNFYLFCLYHFFESSFS